MKKSAFSSSLLALSLICGCAKSTPKVTAEAPPRPEIANPAVAATPAPQEPNVVAVTPPIHGPGLPAPVAATPVVIPDNGNSGAALSQLSLELRRYVVRTKIAPKTFDEFVALSGVQAPAAPAGKKYAIKSGAVILTKL